MLTQLSSHHYHTLKVWYLVQHSLVSFKKIIDYFGNCEKATQPDGLAKWSSLGLHANHLKRVKRPKVRRSLNNLYNKLFNIRILF